MKKINTKKITTTLSFLGFYLFLFDFVFAQGETHYTLLEPLPGIGDNGTVSGFGAYISGAFKLAIGLATVLAVVQLSIAGFKYLTTESFTGTSDAKKTINQAIFGLILLLSSYLLLRTINPDLVSQDLIIPPVGSKIITESNNDNSVDNEPNIIYLKQTSPIGTSPYCAQPTITNNGVVYNYVSYEPSNYICHTPNMSEQDRFRGCCKYSR